MNLRSAVSLGSRLGLLFLLTFILNGNFANVAAQSFRGGIRGEVTDAHGLHVAGAKVTARNLGTSETREVTADSDGEYRFVELPVGEYEISAMAPGLEEAHVDNVRVSVGVETIANVSLSKVKGSSEVVNAVETVPLLDTSSTTLSEVVDRRLVQELPLNGRLWQAGGASRPASRWKVPAWRERRVSGSSILTAIVIARTTRWTARIIMTRGSTQFGVEPGGNHGCASDALPLDAIQEFNLQSQFSAEYGRNSGSIVNIVTRSGSNAFHGSLYEYNRNSAFDARNYFNTTKIVSETGDLNPNPQSHFNNNNFGGSLGGPIFKDKTFFFVAYEGQRERVGSDFALRVPTTDEIAQAAGSPVEPHDHPERAEPGAGVKT